MNQHQQLTPNETQHIQSKLEGENLSPIAKLIDSNNVLQYSKTNIFFQLILVDIRAIPKNQVFSLLFIQVLLYK